MQLKIMPKKKCLSAGRALLILILCPMLSALEVPLDLVQPPTITQQSPKDYIIDPRENIVIQCEAKGKPPPSFSWTRNGTHFDIDKDPLVTMKTGSGTLTINIMSDGKAETYEGVYQCTARNERGAAISNNIVIRSSRSPLWTKEKLEPMTLRSGQSLVLPCRPPMGLPPPIIFWMDNSFQRLPQSERVSQGLNGDLYFSNVLPEDAREDYICYARFNHTQTIQQKQPISVKVTSVDELNDTIAANLSDTEFYGAKPHRERPPTFLTPEGNASRKEELRGNVLSLECIAEGLPTPIIYWIKEDGTLPINRTFYRNFKKTLQIIQVTEADSGNYQCIAKNTLGAIHHTISVTVKAAPYWIIAPQNLVLSPGEDGTLICRANGNPKPRISWLSNGVPIENNELPSPRNHTPSNVSDAPGKNATINNEFNTIVLPLLYLVIFVASILLNGLAVWIFFHIRNKTSFIFYLKNIVVADLIMTLTFPFRIVHDAGFGPWYFKFILCRYTSVLFYANMYTSIVFLGLISIDRYLKVVKPFGDSRMYSVTFTKVLSICVWVLMAVLSLPNIILTNGQPTKENIHECVKLKSPLGVKWHNAIIYVNSCLFVAVLVILIGCYIAISRYIHKSSRQFISQSSRKRKHNQSIRVVVAVFFTCFLPYHLCRIPFTFSHLDRLLDDSAHKILYYCKEMTLFLSACNVCLDPIIYFFMCRSFSRRLFKKSNIRTRSESIRSLQSVRRSEVRIYYDYTDV